MYRALIVDDEPLVREYLMANLSVIHGKWQAVACRADGYQAAELLKTQAFDAVITDICMPGMDGLELAKHIIDHYEDTFTIILSGHDEFDYARKAVRFDVADYLLKPINDTEFHDALERLSLMIEKRKVLSLSTFKAAVGSLSPDSVSQQFRNYLTAVNSMNTDESNTLADRATEFIYAHFCEPIALSDVADALNVSTAYLSNIFHSVKGESYSKFLLRLRMERATLLLDTCPNTKVYSIAEEIGYASSKHFIGVFKKYFGITPHEYRENPMTIRKSISQTDVITKKSSI